MDFPVEQILKPCADRIRITLCLCLSGANGIRKEKATEG